MERRVKKLTNRKTQMQRRKEKTIETKEGNPRKRTPLTLGKGVSQRKNPKIQENLNRPNRLRMDVLAKHLSSALLKRHLH